MDEFDKSKIPAFTSTDDRVSVGRYTYGSPNLMLWSADEGITIGSFCSIAPEVTIFGGGEHNSNWVTTFPLRIAFGDPLAEKDGHPASKGRTVIGSDVWIGYRAMILSGVKVGNGAIIGAGTVVARDVPDYGIVVGNPARLVRYRFDMDAIAKLLKLSWWNWPIIEIKNNLNLLCSNNLDCFFDAHKIGSS